MPTLFFDNALLPEGWAKDVLIRTDAIGKISAINANSAKPATGSNGRIAVPGMANLHSHAFQRAMAGLGEWRGSDDNDSFWSWRDVMYRFLERLRPEDLRAIATQLYIEMLEAGFTAVGEFHYVHHQPDGTTYDDLTEMPQQLLAAANEAGIGLTLLPVFYQHGGFGGVQIQKTQHSFYNDPARFLTLIEQCREHVSGRTVLGIAPHSLRAITPKSLDTIVKALPNGPIHIHIAEQTKEVDDCIRWSGMRPVQWLLEHQPVDARWCLVHATHMDEAEIKSLAQTKAIAGLCPITEANLGDGIFEGVSFHNMGGRWGIGSDSNIRIDLAEELRSYEYSQRLRDQQRNRLVDKNKATGRALFDAASYGGAHALQQSMGSITIGYWCDIVSLDAHHPVLIGKSGDDWLNSWIFAGDKHCIADVWVSGNHVVRYGRHIHHQSHRKSFTCAMQHLIQG